MQDSASSRAPWSGAAKHARKDQWAISDTELANAAARAEDAAEVGAQATAGLSARHLAPSTGWLQASLQAAVRMTAPDQFAQAAVDGQAPQPRTPSELRAAMGETHDTTEPAGGSSARASASGSGTHVYEIVNEAGRGL